jgi:hypothetical protein
MQRAAAGEQILITRAASRSCGSRRCRATSRPRQVERDARVANVESS